MISKGNKHIGLVLILSKTAALSLGFVLCLLYENTAAFPAAFLLLYVCLETVLFNLPFMIYFWRTADFKKNAPVFNLALKLLLTVLLIFLDMALMSLAVNATGGV